MIKIKKLESVEDTLQLAQALGYALQKQNQLFVVHLVGVLGAGKTTFCRGVLAAYGHTGAVKSPTYTLVEPYEFLAQTVFHFDLYRLGDPQELEYMGIRDYCEPNSVCLIEWPQKGWGFLPEADLIVNLTPDGVARQLSIEACSPVGGDVLSIINMKTMLLGRELDNE